MQVPAHVEYERASSVAHALSLLARYGPEARILAGGHSLIPMMKLRLAQPETLIDVNGLSELCYLEVDGGELRIGALTRHAQLLDSAAVGEHFAILHAAEKVGRRVGDWPVGAAGAAIWLAGDVVADAGIGLTAVGARQFAAPEAEEFLSGAPATGESFARAGEIAAGHCRPVSDQRGPAEYKRHLAAELTMRALRAALRRAQG